MDEQREGERRPYKRLSAEERARFLAVLRETGNRKAAAAAIGVEARLMDQRREHDAELDRDWEEAAEAAHRRLSEAQVDAPFGCPQENKLNTIRRGKRGRLQLVAAGEGRWSAEVEARFKEALRESGNVRAAARAVGFSESAVWDRRRKWPAFAQAMEEMLEEAELALEFRIACMGNVVCGEGGTSNGFAPIEGAQPSPTPGPSLEGRGDEAVPFDMDHAMRFLKWREEKRRGGGRRGPAARLPSIEEVTEKIVRRVEAIKRHRAREAGE